MTTIGTIIKKYYQAYFSFFLFFVFFFSFQGYKNRVNQLRRYTMFQSRRHDKIDEKIHKLRGHG